LIYAVNVSRMLSTPMIDIFLFCYFTFYNEFYLVVVNDNLLFKILLKVWVIAFIKEVEMNV
jgi:hypothetical protein